MSIPYALKGYASGTKSKNNGVGVRGRVGKQETILYQINNQLT